MSSTGATGGGRPDVRRRWHRARLAAGAALLCSAAAVALLPTGAGAADLAQAGWWWKAQTGALAVLPPPPQVPEGGFMVAGEPSGATAIAALRFQLDDGESSPELTLRVAEGGDQGGETAVLAACVTGSAWSPTEGAGRWQDKPTVACADAVNGVRSEDGSSWTFALTSLLVDGLLDVVLVPGTVPEAPDGANGSTFQLAFEPVTSADLETTTGDSGGGGSFDVPSLSSFGADMGGGGFGGDLGGDLGAPSFTPPPASGAFQPSLPQEDQGLTATAPAVQQRNPVLPLTPASAEGADTKLLGIVVMALAGVVALGTAREPLPPPQRLGRLAGAGSAGTASAGVASVQAPVGGLGRFARPRSGPVPRL